MHELPVIQGVLDICLKCAAENNAKKIVSILLKVGEMSDLQDEWIQRYFDYLSKGTAAEDAKLKIERVPVVLRCKSCTESFPVDFRQDKQVKCLHCGSTDLTFVSGREYRVESMEII